MKLEELNAMTVQEACDYAVKKIVEQGCRCMQWNDCSYVGVNGETGETIHCAVGWLLPDDSELMDIPQSIKDMIDNYGDKVPAIIRNNREVFKNLQSFHDGESRHYREAFGERLAKEGIDTTPEQYQQWVDLGN
jgi:hypothetical protein